MPNVLIYSTPTCHYCHRAKDYLRSKNVSFTEYNVAEDQDLAQEMINKSGQMGVPVLDINGNIVVGFDQTKINEFLGIQEEPEQYQL